MGLGKKQWLRLPAFEHVHGVIATGTNLGGQPKMIVAAGNG
jgi:hypothetical protein